MPPRILSTLLLHTALPAVADATVLLFNYDTFSGGSSPDQTYGDNVTAETMDGGATYGSDYGFTPNVTVSYGAPGMSPGVWRSSYGDLTNVLFEDMDSTGILYVTFAADPGYSVCLHNMDIAGYWPTLMMYFADPVQIDSLSVVDGSNNNVLYHSTDVDVSLYSHSTIDFGPGVTAETLVLIVDARNLYTMNDEIGIDNIAFSQVPEPSTYALLTGLVVLALTIRRRR